MTPRQLHALMFCVDLAEAVDMGDEVYFGFDDPKRTAKIKVARDALSAAWSKYRAACRERRALAAGPRKALQRVKLDRPA